MIVMATEKAPQGDGDDSALRRFINSTHINPLFIDESLAAEENDDDVDDDDADYEPSELEKLAMMDEDEYVEYMAEYMKRHREINNK